MALFECRGLNLFISFIDISFTILFTNPWREPGSLIRSMRPDVTHGSIGNPFFSSSPASFLRSFMEVV